MPHTITSSLTKKPNTSLHCPVCDLYHPNLVHCFNSVYEADIIQSVTACLPDWNRQMVFATNALMSLKR